MRAFFRGWRRKVGLMTLMTACVFMAGWVRSRELVDIINIPFDSTLHTLFSQNGYIDYRRIKTNRVSGDTAPTLVKFSTEIMQVNWSGEYQDIDFMGFDLHPRSHWTTTTRIYSQINGFPQVPAKTEWCLYGCRYILKTRNERKQSWTKNPVHFEFLYDPYWSIVVPLTLFSAYLLLVKPRQSTQTKFLAPRETRVGRIRYGPVIFIAGWIFLSSMTSLAVTDVRVIDRISSDLNTERVTNDWSVMGDPFKTMLRSFFEWHQFLHSRVAECGV